MFATLESRRVPMMPRNVTTATPTTFGKWLRAARNSRGLTMEVLADRADTAPPVISNLERGTRNASRDMVNRLASALAGPDADDHTMNALLSEGMKAAGFAYEGGMDPRLRDLGITIEAGFNEMSPESQDVFVMFFEGLLERDRKKRDGDN